MAKKSRKMNIPNWKKKKWYELVAPEIYSEKVIGEAFVESPEDLKGKVVQVNMMNLLGGPRKQSFSAKLRVEKVQGNKGLTKPIKLAMLPASVKRLIRSGKNRVDLSFTATSSDEVLLRLKPLIITKTRAPNSTLTDLRSTAVEFLTKYVEGHSYEEMFDAVSRSVIQKELKLTLEKIFPLRLVEIRVLEVELVKGIRTLPESVSVVEEVADDKVESEETKEDSDDSKKPAPVVEEVADDKVESEEVEANSEDDSDDSEDSEEPVKEE